MRDYAVVLVAYLSLSISSSLKKRSCLLENVHAVPPKIRLETIMINAMTAKTSAGMASSSISLRVTDSFLNWTNSARI